MKYLAILSALIIFLLLTVIFVGLTEMSSINRVQQSEIEGLRIQADSLNGVIKLKDDTIRIAKHTIILQDTKIVKDEKEVTTKTDSHEKIVFVNLNDSSRHSKLAKFYPSYKRVGFNALGD